MDFGLGWYTECGYIVALHKHAKGSIFPIYLTLVAQFGILLMLLCKAMI